MWDRRSNPQCAYADLGKFRPGSSGERCGGPDLYPVAQQRNGRFQDADLYFTAQPGVHHAPSGTGTLSNLSITSSI